MTGRGRPAAGPGGTSAAAVASTTVVAPRRLALLALAGVALLAGLTGALALVGVGMPGGAASLAPAHGLLMTLGFLGTLIALERAVALGRWWGYAAPLATALGGLAVAARAPGIGAALLLAGGALFVAMYAAFLRIEASLHTAVQGAGGVAWSGAAALLLAGRSVAEVVPWLAGFLVLTIVGERLELSRLARPSPAARRLFVGAALVLAAGVALSAAVPDAGVRVAGAGMVALAAWLARHDIARRTVRLAGVTRFVALSLLAGYAWLLVAGVLWLGFGATPPGLVRDAALHALFLGFVISMVFGHAPVILPAVLRAPLPWHPRFYAHLALLHAGLLVRIAADATGSADGRMLGGVLGVVALLLFVVSSAAGTALAVRRARGSGRRPAARAATAR